MNMQQLIDISQLAGYIQIKAENDSLWGNEMAEVFEPLLCQTFKICRISGKKDIWPEFAKLFGGKYELK